MLVKQITHQYSVFGGFLHIFHKLPELIKLASSASVLVEHLGTSSGTLESKHNIKLQSLRNMPKFCTDQRNYHIIGSETKNYIL